MVRKLPQKILPEVNQPESTVELRVLARLTQENCAHELRIPDNLDWPKFIQLAEFHRVECLVAVALKNCDPSQIPKKVLDHFNSKLSKLSFADMANVRAAIEISQAMSDAGVQNLLLKGQAVATRFYANPNTRQSIDCDFLIAADDIAAARKCVEQLGFQQFHPPEKEPASCTGALVSLANDITYVRPADGTQLDLHWKLGLLEQTPNWTFDQLIKQSSQIILGGACLSVLSPQHQFLYLCTHGSKHAWFRLKWLADIDRLLDKLSEDDLRQIQKQAQQDGTWVMVASSLKLVDYIYERSIPNFLKEDVSRDANTKLLNSMKRALSSSAAKNDAVRIGDLPRVISSFRYRLALRSDLSYKLGLILNRMTDVRDIHTLQLSQKWLWVYVLLGPSLAIIRVLKRELDANGILRSQAQSRAE